MTERKTDAVLYIFLSIAILGFLYFNIFSGTYPSKTYNNGGWQGEDAQCSCGGTERATNEAGMLVDADAEYGKSDNNPEVYSESGDSPEDFSGFGNNPEAYKEYVDSPVADPQKEEASSVHFTEDIEEKGHKINPAGYHIIVDLDNLMTYVYKDGEPIKSYKCSGGKPNSPSPIGTWKIISKETWGEGFGGAWLGFNVPWGKYGIHGTSEPWSIGRDNASKGCIRLCNSDARELYRLVPYNTLVTIVYDNIPFYPMRDGDIGSDVQAMERALKKLGYYHDSEDGVFGSELENAVMKFQKANKLYSTGVINNSTYEKIRQLEKEYDEKQKQLKQEQKLEEWRKRLEQEQELEEWQKRLEQELEEEQELE